MNYQQHKNISPERYLDLSKISNKKEEYLGRRNVIDEYKETSNEQIRELVNKNSLPCAVLMSHISGDYNFGNILRTSNFVFGGSPIFYYGEKKFDKRFAHGCYHYTKPNYLSSLDEVKKLKERYSFVCIEQGEGSSNITDFTFPSNSLIIMGEEYSGISKDLLDLRDHLVEIPVRGSIRSLCVSSAFAMVSGFYLSQHLKGKVK